MKVLFAGGTGFIGRQITKRLLDKGHEVIILTRDRSRHQGSRVAGVSFLEYSGESGSIIPPDILADAGAVINVAGEPIFTGRWTEEKLRKIEESRVNITRGIVDSMAGLKDKKPGVLVNASAVGYYGARDDKPVTEDVTAGDDFMAQASLHWEAEALKAASFGVRTVVLRNGIVLERDAEVLKKMTLPYMFFIGGPVGSGKQYVSWIHMDDLAEIHVRAITDNRFSGPVNTTAPNPVTMKELSSALGSVLNRPSWFPVPGFLAKLVIGGSAEIVVNGQRVVPEKLLSMGFKFKYTDIDDALRASLA